MLSWIKDHASRVLKRDHPHDSSSCHQDWSHVPLIIGSKWVPNRKPATSGNYGSWRHQISSFHLLEAKKHVEIPWDLPENGVPQHPVLHDYHKTLHFWGYIPQFQTHFYVATTKVISSNFRTSRDSIHNSGGTHHDVGFARAIGSDDWGELVKRTCCGATKSWKNPRNSAFQPLHI